MARSICLPASRCSFPTIGEVGFVCLLFSVLVVTPSAASASSCENGIAYPDTNYSVCECFVCYTGRNCSILNTSCVVDVSDGNPWIIQQFWENHTDAAVGIPTWYRTGYTQNDDIMVTNLSPSGILPSLQQAIFDLHAFIGNANFSHKNLVLGSGATQLVGAVQYAAAQLANRTLPVFAQSPAWWHYHQFAATINKGHVYWNSSYNMSESDVIEFCTSPNNPTGEARQPHYSSSPFVVYDHAYDWPSWTKNLSQHDNHSIMLFTLSKLSGHAGSRFGWAFVDDPELASLMTEYIYVAQIDLSVEVQYRALLLLRNIVATKGAVFAYVAEKMNERWNKLEALFAKTSKFNIQSQHGYFYLWLQCTNTTTSCYQQLLQYNIKGLDGSTFGADSSYVRCALAVRDSTFNIFLNKLEAIVFDSST